MFPLCLSVMSMVRFPFCHYYFLSVSFLCPFSFFVPVFLLLPMCLATVQFLKPVTNTRSLSCPFSGFYTLPAQQRRVLGMGWLLCSFLNCSLCVSFFSCLLILNNQHFHKQMYQKNSFFSLP